MDCLIFSSYTLCVAAILVAGDTFQEDCSHWFYCLPNTSALKNSEAIAHSLDVDLCVKMLLLPANLQSSVQHGPTPFADLIAKVDVFTNSLKPAIGEVAIDAEDRTDSECEGLEGINGRTLASAVVREEGERSLATSSFFTSV